MENDQPVKLVPNGGYQMHTFEDLKDVYFPYITNHDDRALIEKAYKYAAEKHEGQFRKSGESYLQHPLEVAYIVASLQAGPATICSAFLHDVVEDTDTSIDDIKREFNEDVAKIVDSLTKIQRLKLSHRSAAEFEAEDHKKIFLGMAKDVRVIIVKLADRLHNLRTIKALSEVRQQVIAKETLDVFTPIAHRLGIYTVQSELEDLCLKTLEPEKFEEIDKLVTDRCKNGENSLNSLKKRIADILFEKNIPFKIESRVKSIYSIYRKMYLKGHSFDDIYDVLAIRVITQTELNCYEILGIIHSTYKPLPGRFKDYIAMPKPNMYQSLHTSIISGDGQIYEIQIRTEDMDKIAETGIAAHWKYKEGTNYSAKAEQKEIEEKLHWFRDFVAMSGETKSAFATDFVDNINNDIFGANVYVFTPQGKVIDLPTGSSTLDFAYRIHTKVGDSAVGAIVNGVGVPLSTELKTGDICEIRTSKNSAGPNLGWLSIVKSASAKSNIRKALQKKDAEIMRNQNIIDGKNSCIDAFKMQDIPEDKMMDMLQSQKVLDEFKCKTIEDLFVAVTSKNPTTAAIIDFLDCRKKTSKDEVELLKRLGRNANANTSNEPVLIGGGVKNLAITFGNCCNPIPGDKIVGYITRGKGITIHRHDCPNVTNQTKRLIDVEWNPNIDSSTLYSVDAEVYSNDRPNLAADILNVLAQRGVGCNDFHAHLVQNNGNVVISMKLLVKNGKVLEDVKASILGIKGVYSFERITH